MTAREKPRVLTSVSTSRYGVAGTHSDSREAGRTLIPLHTSIKGDEVLPQRRIQWEAPNGLSVTVEDAYRKQLVEDGQDQVFSEPGDWRQVGRYCGTGVLK